MIAEGAGGKPQAAGVTPAGVDVGENERVRSLLRARVCDELLPAGVDPSVTVATDWSIADYSSCFSVEWRSRAGRAGVFVKIPKIDIDRRTVLPCSEGDRDLARQEYRSLRHLHVHWDTPTVRFVEPLAFYEDCNAIVTRRAYATDFYHEFRRADRRRRHGASVDDDPAEDVLRRLGTALRSFHDRRGVESTFVAQPLVEKVNAIAEHLRGYGVAVGALAGPVRPLASWTAFGAPSRIVDTLKGLDVRNVLVDEARGVHLLDPGRLKRTYREADIARLLVTCRILYWGSPSFVRAGRPDAAYERALLDAYAGTEPIASAVLGLHVVKELFKHWRSAYVALTRKRWPFALERVVARRYIDSFYRRALDNELTRLVE